jgi:DnaJ-class molecular chaperone
MDDILASVFALDARARAAGRRGEHQTITLSVDPLIAIRGGDTTVEVRRPTGRSDRLKVRIPAGARDGGKLRLRGQGLPPPGGGPCGDLLIRLKVPDHPSLRRDGDDLEIDVPITVLEAIRGARITVPTPSGDVPVTVPPGALPGQRLRVAGQGVQRPASPGDLYLILRPTLPQSDDPTVLAAAEALERAYGGDVRADLRRALGAQEPRR